MVREMYHTQECRKKRLKEPIICERDDAWLGEAYYFWDDYDDADKWGNNSKRKTGKYEIYKANIDCENVLDTVFNEEHYRFWLSRIELVAKKIAKDTLHKPTIKELNDYFKERGDWQEVTGILFQDLPNVEHYTLIEKIYKDKNIYFAYKKRIQLALFDKSKKVLTTFAHFVTKDCEKKEGYAKSKRTGKKA